MKKLKIFEGLVEDDDKKRFEEAKAEAQKISKEEGVAQHVEKNGDNYIVSDWFDSEKTVATFINGIEQ